MQAEASDKTSPDEPNSEEVDPEGKETPEKTATSVSDESGTDDEPASEDAASAETTPKDSLAADFSPDPAPASVPAYEGPIWVATRSQTAYGDGDSAMPWVWEMSYDEQGNKLISEFVEGPADSRKEVYTYDGDGAIIAIEETLAGDTARTTYEVTKDESGRLLSSKSNEGTSETRTYDDEGRLVSVIVLYPEASSESEDEPTRMTESKRIFGSDGFITSWHWKTSTGTTIHTYEYERDDTGLPNRCLETSFQEDPNGTVDESTRLETLYSLEFDEHGCLVRKTYEENGLTVTTTFEYRSIDNPSPNAAINEWIQGV